MYSETSYFDSTGVPLMVDDYSSSLAINSNIIGREEEDTMRFSSTFSMDELSNPTNIAGTYYDDDSAAAAAIQLDDHLVNHHLDFDLDPPPLPPELNPATWVDIQQEYPMHSYGADPTMYAAGMAAPDLLNLLHLPQYAIPPAFHPEDDAAVAGGGLHDLSAMHLGYTPPPQAQMLRDLFQSLPQNYGLFCGSDERDASATAAGGGGMILQELEGMMMMRDSGEYRREIRGGDINGGRCFPTERQRRVQFNEKYRALRSLVPNPTKTDRASIVGDAIEYIMELRRTITELKILVANKRDGRNRKRRSPAISDDVDAAGDVESSTVKLHKVDADSGRCGLAGDGALRSSWLQRRSRESFVDVRVIEEEVNVKLTQKRNANCLLAVAKALDELNVDLCHVAGGFIGNHYVFVLNAKISDGSSVHAGVIAKKILHDMDASNHSPFHRV